MRLGALKRHWERLGRRDPLWAVLTDLDARGSGRDVERFFQSGVDEIGAVLGAVERSGVVVPRRRALDFGCGVGRLTQAMAGHFERCDGVDISTSMLRLAAQHNRHADRCVYHLNVSSDLSMFEDAAFSFVYSTLVLQHMEPRYSREYIRELLRVLAPDGVLVFQLPSHRTATEPSRGAALSANAGPLPPAACRADIAIDQPALALRAGELATLKVSVENRSHALWPALPDPRGRYRINLANHWLANDGALLQRDDSRCPLPYDLSAGSRSELLLGVTAPAFDGDYLLELDLVQENVGWFAQHGSPTRRIPCTVSGGLTEPHPRLMPAAPVSSPVVQPLFRDRHPRLFHLLQVTGLRDLYWSWRRAVDRVKGSRDRVILWLRAHAYERIVPPLVNWWLGKPFAPKMEMHCVARADVLTILREGGGRVVNVEEELMPGGFQSCRYWVVKGA